MKFSVGDSVPLTSLGHEIWEEVFYFGFTFFPFYVTWSLWWVGVGQGVPVLFQSGLKGQPAEKVCFSIQHLFSLANLFGFLE